MYQSARETAVRFIGIASKSSGKIRNALLQKGFPEDIASIVVSDLTRDGYIDDARVARSIIASRSGKKTEGKRRLRDRMRAHGVEGSVIERIIETVPSDNETIVELLRAKFQNKEAVELNPEEYQSTFQKTANQLRNRGNSFDLVVHALNTYLIQIQSPILDEGEN